MTIGKRIYWVVALVAVMALAGAAVTLTAHFTSASGNTPTPAVQTCQCDEQDGADDGIDNEVKVPEAGDDVIDDECECGSQDEADDAIESAAKGPDTDNIEEQSGDQNQADDANEAEDGDIQAPSGTLDDGKDLLPQAGITLEQAVAAAQGAASGPVGEIDLEHAQGRLVFNVDIGDKDVKVDASDGSIVAVDSDD
jgi:uncharacterized membrane protein YkoI